MFEAAGRAAARRSVPAVFLSHEIQRKLAKNVEVLSNKPFYINYKPMTHGQAANTEKWIAGELKTGAPTLCHRGQKSKDDNKK
jgi:hypothetical protein